MGFYTLLSRWGLNYKGKDLKGIGIKVGVGVVYHFWEDMFEEVGREWYRVNLFDGPCLSSS